MVDSELAAHQAGAWVTKEFPGAEGISEEERLGFVVQSARKWLWRTEVTQRAYDAHPGPKLTMRYEELLVDAPGQVRMLLDRLGLEMSDAELLATLDRHAFENVPAERRGSLEFFRAASPGLWRENLSAEEQAAMEEVIGPKLSELGMRRRESESWSCPSATTPGSYRNVSTRRRAGGRGDRRGRLAPRDARRRGRRACPAFGGQGPLCRARDIGWRAAEGDVILFVDVRSRPGPHWGRVLTGLFEDPRVALAGSDVLIRGGTTLGARAGERQQFYALRKYTTDAWFRPYLPTCNLAARARAHLEAVDGFREIRSGAGQRKFRGVLEEPR